MRVRRALPDPDDERRTNNYVRLVSGDLLNFDDRFAEERARVEEFVRAFTDPGCEPCAAVWSDYPGRPPWLRVIGRPT